MNEVRTIFDPFHGKAVEIRNDLTLRLRGKYANGPTLPNGEPEFGWREFGPVPQIQNEAADEIDRLRKEAKTDLERLTHAVTGLSQLIADVEPIAITGRLSKAVSDARAALDKACRT